MNALRRKCLYYRQCNDAIEDLRKRQGKWYPYPPEDRETYLQDAGYTIPVKCSDKITLPTISYGGSGTTHYFSDQEGFNPFPLLHPKNMTIKVSPVLTLQQFLEIEGEYEAN